MNKRLLAMLFAVPFVGVFAQDSDVADVRIENEAAALDVSSESNDADVSQDSGSVDACNGGVCDALSQNEDGSDVAETDIDVEAEVVELA
jgi:hypothetical protein